ncbi:Mariner Mos1 transposase [Eumeta japonica]|uniref:Mariner Mos1 transposase n=1 Tax=Eumeta variegata TaxID=151549 RepID=A0A4C1Y2G0_EUMVA|nr:Mariner Mos1 transposase [Eumeta japonica]
MVKPRFIHGYKSSQKLSASCCDGCKVTLEMFNLILRRPTIICPGLMAHALLEQRYLHITSYEDSKNWVDSWIASKNKEFSRFGILALLERWKKVVASDGQ